MNKKKIVIGILIVLALAVILFLWMRKDKDVEQLKDLSLTGVITTEDGVPCFISDQKISGKADGVSFRSENKFFIDDPSVLEEAEKHVTMKIDKVYKENEHYSIEPQFFVSDDVCIPTPYGLLHCSAQWADYLAIEKNADKNSFALHFKCNMDNTSYDLFTISFGDGQGDPIGKVMYDELPVSVYTYVSDPAEYREIDETERDIIYAMDEEINYLYHSLCEMENFTNEV